MSIPELSHSLAGYLGQELNLDEENRDILRYGFEVLIGESFKLMALFAAAFLLGLGVPVLVCFLTVGIYRLFSGGYHSPTYGLCFLNSMLLFLGMGKLAQLLLPYFRPPLPLLCGFLVLVFIGSLGIARKWTPAETPNKPLSQGEKARQKKLSLLWVLLWFGLTSYLTLAWPWEKTGLIILATLIAQIFQSVSVTPLGFKLGGSIDTLAERITKMIMKRGKSYV